MPQGLSCGGRGCTRTHDIENGLTSEERACAVTGWCLLGLLADAPAPPVPARPELLVVIGCGKRKLSAPAQAGLLYTGSYHGACRATAAALTAERGQVRILSARHGLLPLDRVVAPYDERMPVRLDAAHVERLRAQAGDAGVLEAEVIVLAGRSYAQVVREVWPGAVDPFAHHRGLGRQLAWMRRERDRMQRRQYRGPLPPPARP